jgi:hypothetical protein
MVTGTSPPPPFPGPGADPTPEDPLGCEEEAVTPPVIDFNYVVDWERPAGTFQGARGVDAYLLATTSAPIECFSIAYRVNLEVVSGIEADFADTVFPPERRDDFEGSPFFRVKQTPLGPGFDLLQIGAVFTIPGEGGPAGTIPFAATTRALDGERLLHLSLDVDPEAPVGANVVVLDPVAAADLPAGTGFYNEFCRSVPAGAGGGAALGGGAGEPGSSQETLVPLLEPLALAALQPGEEFLRGDGNCDGQVNISDMSSIANWLFSGGPAPCCREAANINFEPENPGSLNSRQIDVSDPIYLGNFLFGGGPPPAFPFNRSWICEYSTVLQSCAEPCFGGVRE